MKNRPQVGVIGSAAGARMCHIGGGTAQAIKQIIGNALLTNVRKAI